jgi:hypothetical protein
MNHQTEVPQMDHQQFEDWMDVLRKLAVDAFTNDDAFDLVRSIMQDDADPRERAARTILERKVSQGMRSDDPDVRMTAIRRMSGLPPLEGGGADVRHTG